MLPLAVYKMALRRIFKKEKMDIRVSFLVVDIFCEFDVEVVWRLAEGGFACALGESLDGGKTNPTVVRRRRQHRRRR